MDSLNDKADQAVESVKVDTLFYGQVILDYCENEISGAYEESPFTTVRIRREGKRTHKRTPIGTRNSSNLQATIDDRTVTLNLGGAHFLKRSYRVGIEFDGHVLTLSARDSEDSILLNGPKNLGDNVLGTFTRIFGGGVDVIWSGPFKFGKRIIEPPTPLREDALVGTVAAAAFGTGGLSATTIIMGAVASWFPG